MPGTASSQRYPGGPVFPTPEFISHPPRSEPYQSGEILARKMRLAKSHSCLAPGHLVGRGRKSPRPPPDCMLREEEGRSEGGKAG